MIRKCEICGNEFNANVHNRKYCYVCSEISTRKSSSTRKHHKTILRRKMKEQAVKIMGGKCMICGYDKCIDALEFHHEDPNTKEFQLSCGNTRAWDDYIEEVKKCILVCSNCHKEIHSRIGYN